MNEHVTYTVIRTRRKTVELQVKGDGQVVVRAPLHMADRDIRQLVKEKEDWIKKHIEKCRAKDKDIIAPKKLSREELEALAEQALKVVPARVSYYAPLVGVTYGRITIRNQRTRWGSCSQKGNLNFNCLLMLAPPEVLDSVVVHELCHRKEMNHSKRFYDEVYRVFPEYDKWHSWLKVHGNALMSRM